MSFAKKNPGQLTFSGSGTYSANHLLTISLNKKDSSFIIRDYNINKGENIYDYSRNTPLTSYFKGIDKINKIGVKSVRYGASSNEKCPNKLVLDYLYLMFHPYFLDYRVPHENQIHL